MRPDQSFARGLAAPAALAKRVERAKRAGEQKGKHKLKHKQVDAILRTGAFIISYTILLKMVFTKKMIICLTAFKIMILCLGTQQVVYGCSGILKCIRSCLGCKDDVEGKGIFNVLLILSILMERF